jgi:hypothetical protein
MYAHARTLGTRMRDVGGSERQCIDEAEKDSTLGENVMGRERETLFTKHVYVRFHVS